MGTQQTSGEGGGEEFNLGQKATWGAGQGPAVAGKGSRRRANQADPGRKLAPRHRERGGKRGKIGKKNRRQFEGSEGEHEQGAGRREERGRVPATELQLVVRQGATPDKEVGWGLPITGTLKSWAIHGIYFSGGRRRLTQAISSSDGDEGQKCTEEDTAPYNTSISCHLGVGGAHEADGVEDWGGVAPGVGNSGYTGGAMGAAGTGYDRVEHGFK